MTLEELMPSKAETCAVMGGTCCWCGAAQDCADEENLMFCIPRNIFRRSDEPACSLGWDESLGLLKPGLFEL